MRVWRPVRSLGGLIGCLLGLGLWIAAVGYAFAIPGPVDEHTFWSALCTLGLFVLGCVLLYWGVAGFTLRYAFDRNGLTLHWGPSRQVIPMNHITALRRWQKGERVWEWGLVWPGYHRGRGRSAELKQVHFFATAGRAAQLVVCTAKETFVISPRQPKVFIQEMEVRRRLGMTRQLSQERHHWRIFGWGLWRNAAFWVLGGLALAVNFSLFGFLCYRYPSLPPLIPIHFVEIVEEGQYRIIADIIGRSRDLFKLPAFGLVILTGNFSLGVLLHRRHRLLVVLLLAVALAVQIIFWLGAFYILSR